MSQVFQTTRLVQFCETDAAGIAHFSSFIIYMEQAEHEFLRSLGESVVTRDSEGIISWPRVACSCEFSGPVHFEDEVQITLRIEHIGRSSVAYGFQFESAGRTVATGSLKAVCCRVGDGPPKSIEIPETLRDKLSPFLASAEN